jgi:hypothetical protein
MNVELPIEPHAEEIPNLVPSRVLEQLPAKAGEGSWEHPPKSPMRRSMFRELEIEYFNETLERYLTERPLDDVSSLEHVVEEPEGFVA